MKKHSIIFIVLLLLISFSCEKENDSDVNVDTIIGIWSEAGAGVVFLDGTNEYAEPDAEFRCPSKVAYESNGNFKVTYYDESQNQCIETSIEEGTWKKIDESNYEFYIVTNTANPQKEDTTYTLEIKFPDSETMRLIFNPFLATQDYSYEQYERID